MRSYITSDGEYWYAFCLDDNGRIWPCQHRSWYATLCLDGVRQVSHAYLSRRSARRLATQNGKYCGYMEV